MASIRPLGGNKWQATISAGFDGSGKRKRIYKTFTAKDEEKALAKAIKLEAEVEKGDYQAPSKYTFSSYVDEWKKNASRTLAPKTMYRYNELLSIHILPQIGNCKLENINALMIEKAYDEIRKPVKREYTRKNGTKGEKYYTLSESTIKHCHRIVSAILQTAYRKGLIKENPCSRVDAPQVKKQEPHAYNEEQIAALIEALEDQDLQFKTAVHIALSGGLRLGEVCGLEWSDVNYDKNTISINRTSQYLPGQGIFTKEPKNETSKRMICLPAPVMDMIKRLQTEQKKQKLMLANKWDSSNRLFTTVTGSPIHPCTPTKWLKAFLEEKELPPLKFHELRHTSASYLIAAGEDVVTVAKRLGHSNSNTTLSVYAHAFKKRDEDAADKMAGMYSKKGTRDGVKNG